jgi:hypothetical protein
MKVALFLAGMSILAGCAGSPQASPDTSSYVGDEISALTDRLGDPKKETGSDGQTIYKWTKVATIDGIVNGDEFQASQSAQGSSRFNVNECRLQAATNAKGIIQNFHVDGDCGRVMKLLQ